MAIKDMTVKERKVEKAPIIDKSEEYSSEGNPYYNDDRKFIRDFLLVKPVIYENEFMEEYMLNAEKEKLFLKIIFAGAVALIYAFL